MKRIILFTGIIFVANLVYSQQDISKKYGHNRETLTLSKGKYKETFDNDEIMQVGTVLINTRTEKVVKFLEADTTEHAYKAELTSRFLTVDPLAEEYYSWSPYVYVGNNPIKRTDPTGMDWYEDKDGSYQYDPKVNKNTKLKDGQKYVGKTSVVKDSKGNAFASFRADGSIMFANEGAAYARMVTNSKKTGEEEMAALTTEGTLVLPSYKNKGGEVDLFDYDYNVKNGNIVDASGKEFNTVALAHTHPNGGGATGLNGDGSFMAKYFPNKPNYIFKMNNGELKDVSYILSNGTRPFTWESSSWGSLFKVPGMNSNNILKGKVSLRSFTRQNLKLMKQSIGK